MSVDGATAGEGESDDDAVSKGLKSDSGLKEAVVTGADFRVAENAGSGVGATALLPDDDAGTSNGTPAGIVESVGQLMDSAGCDIIGWLIIGDEVPNDAVCVGISCIGDVDFCHSCDAEAVAGFHGCIMSADIVEFI